MTLAWVIYLIENITNLKGSFWGITYIFWLTCIFWLLVFIFGSLVVFIYMEWGLEEFKASSLFTVFTKTLKWWFYAVTPLS